MSQFIRQLQSDLLICLSSNAYYLNLIEGDQTVYRIDSEEKIIFFREVSAQKLLQIKQLKQKKLKLVLVVNRRLEWSVFVVQKQAEPFSALSGKIPYDQDQFQYSNSINTSDVVQIHQLSGRFLLVLSDLRIYEFIFAEKVKSQLSSLFNLKNQSKFIEPIHIHFSLIYPSALNDYIPNSYLPSLATHTVAHSIGFQSPENGNNQSMANFLIVFRPKNVKNQSEDQSQTFDSIYALNFDSKEKILLSGKDCVLSIPNKITGLYLIGNNSVPKVLIQTSQQLYLWNFQSKENNLLKLGQHKFISHLTIFTNSEDSLAYVGFAQSSNQNQIQKKELNLVKISFAPIKGVIFETISKLFFNRAKPLLYFRNPTKQEESYLFYQNYSISKIKNIKQQLSEVAIFQDQSAFTSLAKVLFIEPMTNILMVRINTQFSSQKIILTNTFLQTERSEYHHNLPLATPKVKHQISNNKEQNIIMTSPVIGTLFLKLGKPDLAKIMIQPDDEFKPFTGQQCLEISQSRKILINSQQIIFSTEPNKQNKFPSLSISKVFQSSTDYIEKAVIFEKSQIFLLSLDDQIHVFEGNSEKNFKRKFIHCCASNVKSMVKLNDVNVFAVQLYVPHNQSESHEESLENYFFEIYVLRQDKFTLLNKVEYEKEFRNSEHRSFLSHINTVPHYFNFIWGKVLAVSSEQTHRYNPQKVKIQIYPFPNPLPSYKSFSIIPLINLTNDAKNNTENQFLLYGTQNHSNSVKIFTGSFSKKFLVKSFDQIKFNFETVVLQSNSFEGRPLFSTLETDAGNLSQRKKKLMIYTTTKCYYFGLTSGKMSLSNFNSNFSHFIDNLFGLDLLNDIGQYKGLQKIEGPLKICKKQNSNSILKIGESFDQTKKVLIHNKFEIWYASMDEASRTMFPISVYTMVNNDFLEFRNNLSVEELDEPEFIKIFSLKLPIVQVKYLSDDCIIVLFEKQIVILEVGQNNSLTVRQEIVFSKAKQNEQEGGMNANEYSSIKIVQLLDKASQSDIFLKDFEGRLYVLSLNEKSKAYEIKFDRTLEEDIVYVGRVRNWEEQKISMHLFTEQKVIKKSSDEVIGEELIVKKDSQMILKDLKSKKQKAHYI